MLKIAVDIGAHSRQGNGISRYISELLPRLQRIAGNRVHWYLYGRRNAGWENLDSNLTTFRNDGLFEHGGRILSLFVSLPFWLAVDVPDVFWSPAHRLPVWIPKSTKRVLTIHDMCWLNQPETMRLSTRLLDRLFVPASLQSANQIIAVSNATADDIRAYQPTLSNKIQVIFEAAGLAKPLNSNEIVESFGIIKPYMLFVGTMEPRKNISRLLDAMEILKARGKLHIDLVIVGKTGWGRVNFKDRIASSNLTQHVKILESVDEEKLASLYLHSQFLILPSVYEGFGLPLIESMAMGRPVLTSNVSSMPEVAGSAGHFVNPLSTDSIAQGIEELVSNPDLLDAYAKRTIVESRRFNWDYAAEKTWRILHTNATKNCL